jgi:hypothetical protein
MTSIISCGYFEEAAIRLTPADSREKAIFGWKREVVSCHTNRVFSTRLQVHRLKH